MSYKRTPYGRTAFARAPYSRQAYGLSVVQQGLIFNAPLFRDLAAGPGGDPTYSRASDASYVDGLVKYVTGGRVNLVVAPQELGGAGWTVRGTATLSSNDTEAPDGSNSGDTVSDLRGPGDDFFNSVQGSGAGVPVAASLYIKRVSTSGELSIQSSQGPADGLYLVDLALIGSEWIRVTDDPDQVGVTVSAPFRTDVGSTVGFQVFSTTAAPLAASYWGFQLEEVDIAAAGPSGYVAEVRNKLLFSQEMDNAACTVQSGASIVADQAAAPDGTLTAEELTFDATNVSRVQQQLAGVADNVPFTFSFFARTITGTREVRARIVPKSTGSEFTAFTATEEWQRFEATAADSGTGAGAMSFGITNAAAGGAATIEVWGAQAEPGSSATGYVATTTAQVIVIPDEPRFESGVVNEGRENLVLRSAE